MFRRHETKPGPSARKRFRKPQSRALHQFAGAMGVMERRRWAARSNVKSHMAAILCAGPQEQETVLRHFRASQRRALRDALVAGTISAATVGAAPRLAGAHTQFASTQIGKHYTASKETTAEMASS
jgi:hypothetical protein